ncbi:MAG: DNA topoisomerase (ATP-hydrolyzing) subunit B [Erysipelotrichaceae bacterium]|nr:DNA topoisomerase (ATP-hydrolyzing) subunit B [Erysipelotrichaceae bacterium]
MEDLKKYDASNIQVLEGLEAVRKRPGMYIGTTSSRGLHHLVWEIVDNSIDEALAGYANTIDVKILPDNIIEVTDNGRGMPVDIHPKTGKSAVETIFTVLHAGGKFDSSSYKVSGGLHGVGASVVNALSEWLEVVVHRNNKEYYQKFERGHVVDDLKEFGESDHTGTKVRFKADALIFTDTTVYDYEILRSRIQQLAFLNKGIKISISDLRGEAPVEVQYCYEGGINEYVTFLNKNRKIINENIIYCENEKDNIQVEIAIQYSEEFNTTLYSFTNNIHTHEGGMHEDGFKMALTRELKKYANDNKLLKKDEEINNEDVREGLTAIISVKHPDPQFEGQTKTKLGNSEVRAIVSQLFGDALNRYLMENPKEARAIIEKSLLASRARLAARKARETIRKSPLESFALKSKLADCRSKDPVKSEMYIVEGDSAGGSAKSGRNSEFQAILPLRGKVLNVQKVRLERALSNNEILSMIQAIGTGIGEEFDLDKARYHKIVIMTDADVDGEHICILLLTFFYRFMPQLIEAGYIYVAKPPLYKAQRGNSVKYAYSDQELEDIKSLYPDRKLDIQRYKGLGEMDAHQLWETTMDPENRTLVQVHLEDAFVADQTFEMLMGEEVEPRKKFIQENAHFADNLDI